MFKILFTILIVVAMIFWVWQIWKPNKPANNPRTIKGIYGTTSNNNRNFGGVYDITIDNGNIGIYVESKSIETTK